MNNVLVVAPHADDELLGVGGTLLRRKMEGCCVAWVIVTDVSAELGWSSDATKKRAQEIEKVKRWMAFDRVYQLGFPAAQLEHLPMNEIIVSLSEVFRDFMPAEVFIPHHSDAHSDHRVVFEVASACCKWFRYPSIRKVLAYETLSETGFGLIGRETFSPNYFVDIENYLEKKLDGLLIYTSEIYDFPFPRSLEAVRSLAQIRGAASGYLAAEAFELLKERS